MYMGDIIRRAVTVRLKTLYGVFEKVIDVLKYDIMSEHVYDISASMIIFKR